MAKTTRIRFDGPLGGHELIVGDTFIPLGGEADVSTGAAKELLAADWVDVSVVEDAPAIKPEAASGEGQDQKENM